MRFGRRLSWRSFPGQTGFRSRRDRLKVTSRDAVASSLIAFAVLGSGCVGGIAPAQGDVPEENPEPGGTTAPSEAFTPASAACGSALPTPSIMRRLTQEEHIRILRDLVGPAVVTAAFDLPPENFHEGFDGIGEAQAFTVAHLRGYLRAAQSIVRGLGANAAARDALFGCEITGAERSACLSSFVRRFGRRAFRRPLTTEETQAFVALAGAPALAASPEAGPLAVVEAMLTSPNFLFVVEAGVADPLSPGAVRLEPYTLATRLSFLLWGTGPDDQLLDEARDGALSRRDKTITVVRRLLADPRATEGVWAFARRWLRIHRLAEVEPEERASALLPPELRASMQEETRRLVTSLVAPRVRLAELLTSSKSALDARLSEHYGIARSSANSGWDLQELRGHGRGGGVFGQASFLVSTAKTRLNTPISRAVVIREALLCRPPPPPPPDVSAPELGSLPATAPVSQILAAHLTAPACAACHTLLDPLGYGLERFGRLGEWRTSDEYGHAIDGRGQLIESTPPEFTGPAELGEKLVELPEFTGCAARHLFRYATGRHESDGEGCALDALGAAVAKSDGTLGQLVESLVTNVLFASAAREI